MKKILSVIVIITVCVVTAIAVVSQCSSKEIPPSTKEAVANAYNADDMETVVKLCDPIYEREGTVDELAIAYALALGQIGKAEKAIGVLKDQITKEPLDYKLHQVLGDICLVERDYDEAIKAYDTVIRLNPNYARPYIHLGMIYEEKEQSDKAAENYTEATRLFITYDYFDETIDYGCKVLKYDKSNLEMLYYVALAYDKKKEYAEAYEYLTQAMEIISDNNDTSDSSVKGIYPYIYFRAGRIELFNKRYDIAAMHLTVAHDFLHKVEACREEGITDILLADAFFNMENTDFYTVCRRNALQLQGCIKDDVETQIKVFIDDPEAMMEYTANVLDLPE